MVPCWETCWDSLGPSLPRWFDRELPLTRHHHGNMAIFLELVTVPGKSSFLLFQEITGSISERTIQDCRMSENVWFCKERMKNDCRVAIKLTWDIMRIYWEYDEIYIRNLMFGGTWILGICYTTSYNNVWNGKWWGNMRKHDVNIYRCTQEKALISEHKVHAAATGIHRYWKQRWTTNYYLSAYMVKRINESYMGLSKNPDINQMVFPRVIVFFPLIVFPSAGFTPSWNNSYCVFFVGYHLTTTSFTSVFRGKACICKACCFEHVP